MELTKSDYVVIACGGPGEHEKQEPTAWFSERNPGLQDAINDGYVELTRSAQTAPDFLGGKMHEVRLTSTGVMRLGYLAWLMMVKTEVEF